MMPAYHVPMVEHTVRVLEAFTGAESELSLKEVSSLAGVGRTSAFRILFTLNALGFVLKDPSSGKYRLGPKMREIAWRSLGAGKLVDVARPYLQELYKRFNETVNLAVFHDGQIIYVEILVSSQSFRTTATVGSRLPFHSTALGKAIAASLPQDVLEAILERCAWTRFTPHTITSRRKLIEALRTIRARGYASDDEETERGASCLGAPILGGDRCAVAALSISGPTPRIHAKRKAIIRELRTAAASISKSVCP
jgi:IclR family acetate operon transcriptional repressor